MWARFFLITSRVLAMTKITAVQIDPPKLHKTIVAHFSLDEIRDLCFVLSLDFDELPPGNKSARARGLVELCQRQRRLAALAEAVLQQRDNIQPSAFLRDIANDDAPFKGLLAFEEADEEIFFGREALTAELVARVHGPEITNFLAIVGASGSGKSSVVRAGMIPELRRHSDWPIHLITPTAHPLQALATSLTRDSESVTATATLMDDLQTEPRALRLYAARLLQNGKAERLLLVIDQFEELFTLCKDEAERNAFVKNLVTAVAEDNPITILLTLRADFYHHCLQYQSLHRLLEQRQKIVPPMSSAELRAAIELPAQQANLTFDEGLVDILLRDVGAADNQTPEPGALPLLSHALLETWQRRDPHENRLMLAGYTEAGGVQGAIAKTAESTYRRLPADQQKIARSIFLRLTELGEGTQDTRRRAALAELLPQNDSRNTVEQVLNTLADARLLTTSDDGAEVAHEALIRQWPTLQSWLDEDRDSLRLHRQLTEAAQSWEVANKDVSYLYRGGRLTQTDEWLEKTDAQLNALEADFLQASQQQQRDELADAYARAKREADAAQKLRQRAIFLRAALVLAAALAFIAFVLFGNANRSTTEARNAEATTQAENVARTTAEANAVVNETLAETRAAEAESAEDAAVASANEATTREAEAIVAQATSVTAQEESGRQRRIALAQSVAALSNVVLEQSNDSELAVLLAIEGARLNWSEAGDVDWLVDDALRSYLGARIYFNNTLRGHEASVNSVAFSPDGRMLASGGDDATIRLWNLNEPTTGPLVLHGHEGWVSSVVFSPDGERLASGSFDAVVRLWNLSEPGAAPEILNGHEARVNSVAFSPDGQTAASGSFDETIRLWDLNDLTAEPLVLRGHEASVNSVAFSPDGQTMVSGSDDETIRLWNLSDPIAEPLVLRGHEFSVNSVAFSPDGQTLASSSDDETVRLWDLNDLTAEPLVLHGHEALVSSLMFNPDGQMLASSSLNATIRLWNLSDPIADPIVLFGHKFSVNSVAFSPDGQTLASGSDDETIRLWDLSVPVAEPLVLRGDEFSINSIVFNPDGQTLASGSFDSSIRLWNLSDPTLEPLILSSHELSVNSVAFSPDGQTLASGSFDETIRLWDLSNPSAEPWVLRGHEGWVYSVAFSPDGQTLASSSFDETIRVWNLGNLSAEPLVLRGHEFSVYSIAFSPDGRTLASSGYDETIRLWNLGNPSGEPLILRGHEAWVYSVVFSPDGQTLATSGDDNMVRLWNLNNPSGEPLVLRGHEALVSSVAFSPDGHTLASGSFDATVRLWNLNDPSAEPLVLRGHEFSVHSVAFSPDGRTLASGSFDATIQMYIFLEELVEIGCQKVRRNLSWEEWQRYLPGEPYRQTCPNLPPHPSVPVEELQ